MKRRNFLQFLGTGAVSMSLLPPFMQACSSDRKRRVSSLPGLIRGISPSVEDELILAEGLSFKQLISFRDPLNGTESFGFNNDYTAFVPDHENSDKGTLWVNHEYTHDLFISGYKDGEIKTKTQADIELRSVGGSILRVQRSSDGQWELIPGADHKRLHGLSEIPFNWDQPIAGSSLSIGTFQNCSGGVTPWGSILTCEENYQHAFGEAIHGSDEVDYHHGTHGWEAFYDHRPEHYGWVVEVDLKTGAAQKHVALGRFCHECATLIELADGRLVVYSGDDGNDQFLYKFISAVPGSLKEGTLYVANMDQGIWMPMDISDERLSSVFKDQTEVLIHCRKAGAILGATPLDRPEDIEIDPVTGDILMACTNNKPKGNYHGQIMKVIEDGGDYASLTFRSEVYLTGGSELGFTCPDNLAFDQGGNLWFTGDMSGSSMHKAPYETFGNNGLFLVPRSGPQAGEVFQVASGPMDSELTGPFFHPDGKTLFLSVQHPGEQTNDLENLTSHWPDGGDALPKPTVVCIYGPLLDILNGV